MLDRIGMAIARPLLANVQALCLDMALVCYCWHQPSWIQAQIPAGLGAQIDIHYSAFHALHSTPLSDLVMLCPLPVAIFESRSMLDRAAHLLNEGQPCSVSIGTQDMSVQNRAALIF